MMTFNPIQWSNKELRKMGGIATATRRNFARNVCNSQPCPTCEYQHLCALMRDVQIMCRKELDKRMKGDGMFDDN